MSSILNTSLHLCTCPKAKPQVHQTGKWYGTMKPEGEARAGNRSLSLWTNFYKKSVRILFLLILTAERSVSYEYIWNSQFPICLFTCVIPFTRNSCSPKMSFFYIKINITPFGMLTAGKRRRFTVILTSFQRPFHVVVTSCRAEFPCFSFSSLAPSS